MWDIINLKGLVLAALIFVPLEHVFALRKTQLHFRQYWKLDVVYALINSLMTKAGLAGILVAAILAGDALVPAGLRGAVANQPIWLQVLLAVMVSDLGFYSMHRLFHMIPWMWKFHAVHHSIEELDWLAGHRVHPFDQICTKGASLVPIVLLGFSEAALVIYGALYYWQSLLVHSNVKFNVGPLRWLIASPQFHHWHHANQAEAYDKNFAGQLSILDYCFGTLHMPAGEYPRKYGTYENVPRVYMQQLAYPFNRRRPPPVAGDQQGPAG